MTDGTGAPAVQDYAISIAEVSAQPLAVIKDRASIATIASRISTLLPEVWMFLQLSRLENIGINVVVYTSGQATDEFDIEVGAEVKGRFNSQPPIYSSSTPAGRVATCTHIGHYNLLPNAHAAIQQWCRENHHRLEGLCWEVYGHWTEDPGQLRTDVYYLLA